VGDVLIAAGWPGGHINQEGLDWLMEKLVSAQSADRLRLAGMREDRKAIIGGGVSVMRAVFKLLGITSMEMATGGLRHGLICDHLSEDVNTGDLRVNSVNRLARKFGVDTIHGQRVGDVANVLFRQLMVPEHAAEPRDDERLQRKLHWAGELHEIGSHISHSDYHKHGAYILDNADAMGFSLSEMHRLSLLVLGHRGKLRKVEAALADADMVAQLVCLRLAVILCHARRDPDQNGMTLKRPDDGDALIRLTCRSGWAEAYPQSAHLLREEVLAWEKTPWKLEVKGV
jgi:exopolyphosphatase/guanosine-5'-triphosphate,3'-diphosphate pyrophosphatase